MKSRLALLVLCTAAFTLSARNLAPADEPLDAETKARVERFEKGPAKVDVSKYPQAIQDDYEVFTESARSATS